MRSAGRSSSARRPSPDPLCIGGRGTIIERMIEGRNEQRQLMRCRLPRLTAKRWTADARTVATWSEGHRLDAVVPALLEGDDFRFYRTGPATGAGFALNHNRGVVGAFNLFAASTTESRKPRRPPASPASGRWRHRHVLAPTSRRGSQAGLDSRVRWAVRKRAVASANSSGTHQWEPLG
jgi:hypothetical protein